MKSLVVYYSRTGTTKAIGNSIANEINADTDEIIDLKARIGRINYMRAARDAKGYKITNIRTEKDPSNYDLIVIGTPIWWGHIPPAIRTYLQNNELNGKKIALFITSQAEDREPVINHEQRWDRFGHCLEMDYRNSGNDDEFQRCAARGCQPRLRSLRPGSS